MEIGLTRSDWKKLKKDLEKTIKADLKEVGKVRTDSDGLVGVLGGSGLSDENSLYPEFTKGFGPALDKYHKDKTEKNFNKVKDIAIKYDVEIAAIMNIIEDSTLLNGIMKKANRSLDKFNACGRAIVAIQELTYNSD